MMDLQDILGPHGPIGRELQAATSRAHVDMAIAVVDALRRRQPLAIEAQPGAATRLAYLAAAISLLESGARRGVISTRTPALQRHILDHDLPLLRRVLPVEFSATLFKLRHHYLGLRRLHQTTARRDVLFSEDAHLQQLATIERWAQGSAAGTIGEMQPPPSLAVWDRVKSEHGNCLGHRCSRYDSCFYHGARRRAQDAQLLVVSHAVLLSDLALRRRESSLLPDYDFVVADEGHALPSAACEQLGLRLSDRQLTLLLDALYDGRTGRGFLAACHAESACEAVAAARQVSRQLFTALRSWQRLHGQPDGRCLSPPPVTNALSPALRGLQLQLGLLRDRLTAEEDLFELTGYMDRCASAADLLEDLLEQHRDGLVYWISLEDGPDAAGGTSLHGCPVEATSELSALLFRKVQAVAVISASLGLDGRDERCAYARRRLGMTSGRALRMEPAGRLAGEVLIESHLPLPDLDSAFMSAAGGCIAGHVAGSPQATLIMAPTALAAESIGRDLRSRTGLGWVFAPGRNGAMQTAQEQPVMVVAEPLLDELPLIDRGWHTLIVVRLPFDQYSSPLVQARRDVIHGRGGHAFREYQLPEAILRFKHCVRSVLRPDREPGRLIILDQRITTRRYGSFFLDAVANPQAQVRRCPNGPFELLEKTRERSETAF